MMRIIHEVIMERDRQEVSLGDTLDVKAGILLATITVLGTLTAALLNNTALARPFQIAQMVSLGLLAIGAALAVLAIFPREYLLPKFPDAYVAWMRDLQDYYGDDQKLAESEFATGMANQANERIHRNFRINSSKSTYLFRAFWPTLLALMIDMGTLAMLGVIKLLS